MSLKVRQVSTEDEGRWYRYEGSAPGVTGDSMTRVVIDAQVRPLLPHVRERITEPYLENVREGRQVVRKVPDNRRKALEADLAEYVLLGLGGPTAHDEMGEPRPHGLVLEFHSENNKVAFMPDAPSYGIHALSKAESKQAEKDKQLVEKPWPMTKQYKLLLLSMFGDFQDQVVAFAEEAVGFEEAKGN